MSVVVRRAWRVFGAYLAAALGTYVLATVAATQWLLGNIGSLGYEISTGVRLATTGQDLWGMLPTYGPMIAVALAIGLAVASGIAKLLPALRGFGLVAGGAAAIMCLHLILQQVLSVSPIWAAQSFGGLLAQGLAGGIGGYLYYLMRRS